MIEQLKQYKIIKPLGAGGNASVYHAWDPVNNRDVALKILHAEDIKNELANFRSEENVMEEIDHPGIVKAYGFDHEEDIWFYVMEYVDGYSFSDLLQRKHHIKEADCLLIAESIAAALDYAWNDHGVVHCDIKPENIMINTEGVVKLTDLGIFHRFEFAPDGKKELPEHITGTPGYISPEQIYGDIELDCRSDIYSLGASLYHLATGRLLFPNRSTDDMMKSHCDATRQALDPRAYQPELSEGFAQLLEAMLVKERDYRLESWRAVFEMCQIVENGGKFKPREHADFAPSSISLLK